MYSFKCPIRIKIVPNKNYYYKALGLKMKKSVEFRAGFIAKKHTILLSLNYKDTATVLTTQATQLSTEDGDPTESQISAV